MPGTLSRRRAALGGALCAVAVAASNGAAAEAWREARPLMGTLVEIQAEGRDAQALRRAAAAAYREMARLTDLMSHYDPHSTVSEINRQAGIAPVAAASELIEVLKMARRVSEATRGAFDVTVGALDAWRFDAEQPAVPDAATIARQRALVNYRDVVIDEARGTVFLRRRGMRLDLGGIAKLYILHAGADALRRHGLGCAMIDGGGDIEAIGRSCAQPWRIGIRHPRRRGALLGVIELRDGFVVSSGDYERYFERGRRRYHHVLDPRTGRPAEGLMHVTLVAPALERVNGYGAALMVLGDGRGRALIERMPGVEALLVSSRGTIWATPGLRHLFPPYRSWATAARSATP